MMTTTKIVYGSEAFFEFLGERPELGRYFALGERVIVVVDAVAYETIPFDEATGANETIQETEQPTIQPEATATPAPTEDAPPLGPVERLLTLIRSLIQGR